MFERTLADLVKGIRATKRDTGLYISSCIAEIKTELSSTDPFTKANALQKLTFLQMMGYDMSWASFAAVEVMSSPRFAHKRIGYLAGSQGFTQDTEVILLTTNLLKKELRGSISGGTESVYEAGLAINCLSNIVTSDLARELLPELTSLTSHQSPYLRKKSILCLFKVFVKYPQGLRLTFDRIRQCLADPEPSVVSCAVNVITELSDKNPKNYLQLAPQFFQLLTSSSNNWMLIKVVKLLGSLVPEEPRLARKLLEPLTSIVKNTQAKSLLYEAVYTITLALPHCRRSDGSVPPNVPEIVHLCSQTLRVFVEDPDQNLKYLGLVGFCSLSSSHPKSLQLHRDLILACLSDEDVTIRTRALDLLTGMATKKNLVELVEQLLKHVDLAEGGYKQELVEKMVSLCCMEKYALMGDFEWYLGLLVRLGYRKGIEKHGELIGGQLVEVALRVLPVRQKAVEKMMEVLLGETKDVMKEVLPAAAWIVGEYSGLLTGVVTTTKSDGKYYEILKALLDPKDVFSLEVATQSVYVQSAAKVFTAACGDGQVTSTELEKCVEVLKTNLPLFMESEDVEVQERAFTIYQLLVSLGIIGREEKTVAPVVTDGEVSSEDEAPAPAPAALIDDLLNIGITPVPAPTPTPILQPTSRKRPPTNNSPLSSKCRSSHPTLTYLFTPDPMKPISAKAQKKKRSAPPSPDIDLSRSLDTSLFSFLKDDHAASNKSMEEVSFIRQRPPKKEASSTTTQYAGPTTEDDISTMSRESKLSSAASFQKSSAPLQQPQPLHQQQDPFYLTTGEASLPPKEVGVLPKFGTIQLIDEDDEENDGKKKKKKKKRSKKKMGGETTADLAVALNRNQTVPSFQADVTVYRSDEEDEDDELIVTNAVGTKKEYKGKEFESLAKVDLTVPLRDDEVMPVTKHREVPQKKQQRETMEGEKKKNKKTKKEKKKEKVSKKKKEKKQEVAPPAPTTTTTDDLLDLGGLYTNIDSTASAPVASNPINSAFDDLLDLEAPAPLPLATETLQSNHHELLSMSAAPPPPTSKTKKESKSSKKGSKRPWIKGTIKSTSTPGIIDWNRISLHFRVYNTKEQGASTAATVTIRITNHTTATLQTTSLALQNQPPQPLGNIDPGQASETPSKLGPFLYTEHEETSLDVRGTLLASGCTLPIKLALPASMLLRPVSGLDYDRVLQELSSGSWSAHSVKLEFRSLEPEQVIPALCSFLRAEVVQSDDDDNDGGGNSLMNATLACQSKLGAHVRCLIKGGKKGGVVKVDIKCMDSKLGKSLVSDLKRLEL